MWFMVRGQFKKEQETTNEPALARQGKVVAARQDQASPGYGATGARPAEFSNCVTPLNGWFDKSGLMGMLLAVMSPVRSNPWLVVLRFFSLPVSVRGRRARPGDGSDWTRISPAVLI